MILAAFASATGQGLGVVENNEIFDVCAVDPSVSPSICDILSAGPEALRRIAAAAASAPRYALSDVKLSAPIPRPGKILCIGKNYHAHAAEMGGPAPKTQLWFNKQVTAINGPFDPVRLPAVSDKLDYEAELVAVVGRRARHVPAERALEVVGGYMCGCDYSVRDWQKASPTMMMGKGFDTHCPIGPWVVTPDDVGPLDSLGVRCWVNGELRQNGRVGDMIFNLQQQIAHLTTAFTLEPGDLIFTGTPEGVGVGMTPPRFLTAGDRVKVEIDGIGAIDAEIVAETPQMVLG